MVRGAIRGESEPHPMPNPLRSLTLEQLRRRTSMKWRRYPPDVLPMWVAEMDVCLAEPVAEALIEAIGAGDTGYPVGTAYAEALSDFASRRWGWDGLSVDRTAIVPDVMMGIVEVLRLVSQPGDIVVINSPVYPPFYSFITHSGRQVVEVPLMPSGRLDMGRLDDFFRDHAGETVVYLLCSPHNPTGVVHSADELAEVARLAQRNRVRVIADEIHAPLVMPGIDFTPYLALPGSEDAFSLMSASKAWNLAGLKAAVLVAGAAAVDDLVRLPEEVGHGPSHLGVIAHTAAFHDGEAWLDALILGLDENRRLLADLLSAQLPQVGYSPPDATYLAWLDCTRLGAADPDEQHEAPGIVTTIAGPARLFLEQGKVALSAGAAFGTGGAGHVRLNFATSPTIIEESVRRMASAVAKSRVD